MPHHMFVAGQKGASRDKKHREWSDVESVTYGVVNHGGPPADGQAQRTMEFLPIRITRRHCDHLTAAFIKLVAMATPIETVIIETTTGDAKRRLLRRVTITNAVFQKIIPSDADTASESLELEGEKIKFECAHPQTSILSTVTWNNVTAEFEEG